mgnify:CR=1 FL=1
MKKRNVILKQEFPTFSSKNPNFFFGICIRENENILKTSLKKRIFSLFISSIKQFCSNLGHDPFTGALRGQKFTKFDDYLSLLFKSIDFVFEKTCSRTFGTHLITTWVHHRASHDCATNLLELLKTKNSFSSASQVNPQYSNKEVGKLYWSPIWQSASTNLNRNSGELMEFL